MNTRKFAVWDLNMASYRYDGLCTARGVGRPAKLFARVLVVDATGVSRENSFHREWAAFGIGDR
jgi:hypothetical protein